VTPDHVTAAVDGDQARAKLVDLALSMQAHRDPGITWRAQDDMVYVLHLPRRHSGITQLPTAHRHEVRLVDYEITNRLQPPGDIRRGLAQQRRDVRGRCVGVIAT